MRGKLVIALLVSMGLSATAQAAWLLDFKPHPPTPTGTVKFEASWDGTKMFETPNGPIADPPGATGGGALSTSDPSIAGQVIGGLIVGTPLFIPGVPLSDHVGGGTTFYDVTLRITPMIAGAGAATQQDIGFGQSVIRQPLGVGGFELRASSPNPADPYAGQLLLAGHFLDATLVGIMLPTGDSTQSVQSVAVAYTGGLIGDVLPNKGIHENSLVWSLGGLNNGGLHVIDPTPNQPGDEFVAPFDADMTGLFYSQLIPEPASLSLLGLAALGLLRRNRK